MDEHIKWQAYFFVSRRPWMLANQADLAIDSEVGELWHTAAWEAQEDK